MRTEIENLIKKAAEADDALQAMQFAQAAVNAANAMRVMLDTELTASEGKR